MVQIGRSLVPIIVILGYFANGPETATFAAEKLQDVTSRLDSREEPPVLSARELDVVEEAIRCVLTERRRKRADPYFLTPAKGKVEFEVDDAFLKRFDDIKPNVRKNSEWKEGAGTRVFVDIVRWVSETEVEVRLTLYRAPMSAIGFHPCRFRLHGGKWILKDGGLRMMWIS